MSFYELILNRKSTRSFQEKSIEKEKIEILKKAVLLAPTGKRKNHWDFIFIENKSTLHQLASSKTYGSRLIEKTALAVVIIGDPAISDIWIEDCSIASILLQLQAQELNLGSCWVQIHKREHNDHTSADTYVKELLGIPHSKAILSIVAIGYPQEKREPTDESMLLFEKIHSEKY